MLLRDFSIDYDFAAAENLDYITQSTETDLRLFQLFRFTFQNKPPATSVVWENAAMLFCYEASEMCVLVIHKLHLRLRAHT